MAWTNTRCPKVLVTIHSHKQMSSPGPGSLGDSPASAELPSLASLSPSPNTPQRGPRDLFSPPWVGHAPLWDIKRRRSRKRRYTTDSGLSRLLGTGRPRGWGLKSCILPEGCAPGQEVVEGVVESRGIWWLGEEHVLVHILGHQFGHYLCDVLWATVASGSGAGRRGGREGTQSHVPACQGAAL